MRYRNAKDVLPADVVETLQKYVQGGYLYIPKKEETIVKACKTDYEMELSKRDDHVFLKYLEGWSKKQLGSWYHLSESSIRRIILKERGKAEAMYNTIKKIISKWGITDTDIVQKYPTVWEVDNQYMIKVYDSKESLERNIQILTILSVCGAPVARVVKNINQGDFVEEDGKYWLMTTKLQGNNIADIREAGIGRKMGETIARLHVILKKCENEMTFWDNSLLDEMNGWVKDVLVDNDWELIGEQEYISVVNRLGNVYENLPKQLIHRDVHFGNFLFANGEFSGYIDFDLSQRNIRIFDVGYFLAGLLTKESGVNLQEDEWFQMIRNVLAGYESVVKLQPEEKDALVDVMESIEILFVAYFIQIKDKICADDTAKIFHYIQEREQKIRECFL